MKSIIFDGIRFTKAQGRKYYYNSKHRKHLHQYVWEKANGAIPDGYEIHHIDHDTENNELSNLIMLTAEEHREHHVRNITDEQRQALRKHAEAIRPLAVEWHQSLEGRMWHQEHYENMKEKLYEREEKECKCCGQTFLGTKGNSNLFCSNKCKSKWRRDNGLDDVDRECTNCGQMFRINKYRKTQTCSRKCLSELKRKLKDSPNLQE